MKINRLVNFPRVCPFCTGPLVGLDQMHFDNGDVVTCSNCEYRFAKVDDKYPVGSLGFLMQKIDLLSSENRKMKWALKELADPTNYFCTSKYANIEWRGSIEDTPWEYAQARIDELK